MNIQIKLSFLPAFLCTPVHPHLYTTVFIAQEVAQKQDLGVLSPLRNVINYYCSPRRISLSDHLFSSVTDELTGKMKHLSLITS